MAAITWRNVVGPSLADASRPLELARQGFNDTFSSLDTLITQRQEANALTAREGFRDMLYGAATPEALAAMQGSGEIQNALSALPPEVRAQVRGDFDARLKAMREGATAGFQYQDTMEDRNTRDARAAAEAAILRGDPSAAQAITALPVRFQAPLLKNQDARGQELVERGRGDTRFEREGVKFGQEGESHIANLAEKEAATAKITAETGMMPLKAALYQAQANSANANAYYQRNKLDADRSAATAAKTVADTAAADAIRTKAMDEYIKSSPYSNGSFDTNQGQEAVLKAMKDMKFSPNQIEDTMYNLNKYYGKGAELTGMDGKKYNVPLPVDVVIRAINQSSDNPLAIGFSRRGDNVVNILPGLLKDPNAVDSMLKAQQVLQNREVPGLLAPRPNPLDISVGKKKVTK